MIRAAIYARVSSAGQRDRHTIESQLRDVPAFVARQGWTLVGQYVDDGKSAAAGKLSARGDFARLLADAAAGAFEVVAVVDLDRITRTEDLRERGAILGAFQAAGVKVAVASTGQILDYRTDEGDLLGSLGAYFAAVENRKRRQRVIAGQVTAAGRGRKPRGWTPYGLTYDATSGAWGLDPERAPIVREVIARVAAGEGTEPIAHDLERRGVPVQRQGAAWSSTRVGDLVRSDTYLGRLLTDRARGLVVAVPPIVTPELAEQARAALSARYHRPAAVQRYPSLLTGVARCALCGLAIGSVPPAGDGKRHRYRCLGRRYVRHGEARCELPCAPVPVVDDRVWASLVDALGNPTTVDRALAMAGSVRDPVADPAAAQAEVDRLDRAQASILAQLARGIVSQAVADEQIDRLGRARQAARDALLVARQRATGARASTDGDALAEALDAFRRGCELAGEAARQRLARAVIERAVWRPGVLTADLTIDVATHVAGSARSTSAVYRLGTVAISTEERRRRAA